MESIEWPGLLSVAFFELDHLSRMVSARITDDITLEISTGDVVAALATRDGRALGRGHSLHWEV
jgi:hypothetical protein